MKKKQKDEFKNITEQYPLKQSFMCGSCGFKGELIMIYGNDFTKRRKPGASSVECWVKVFKESFKEDIIIATIDM